MDYYENLNIKLNSLVIFRRILVNPVMIKLSRLISMGNESKAERVSLYADFVSALFNISDNLTDAVWEMVSSDENIYIINSAKGETIAPVLEQCLLNELAVLEELSLLDGTKIKEATGYDGYLPVWKTQEMDFVGEYKNLLCALGSHGYGVFSKYRMFSYSNGALLPVRNADNVRLSELKGYERERSCVVDNTKALLAGKPAANVLLYGDAGTGKSSTVKAVVNEYADEGLRLIEVRKDRLFELPDIIDSLYMNPLKFILFIDDLSYSGHNENIGVLKAILEGTVSAKASNVAIYATSNRRHLISESFSDRGNDDIHINETIQEQISLSERFGLPVYFGRPDKVQYLEIVRELVAQYGVEDISDLDLRAERYALERGGRSPRIAKQFAEYLKSREIIK